MNLVRNCARTVNQDKHIGLSLLALVLIFFGCGGDGSDGDLSSSSVELSSSSIEPSSSSIEVVYGESVTYEGETYQTVVIGTQTWFARNLNYAVEDSKCYGDDNSNCNTYGRLYDWATAMALTSDCNTSECAGQISSKHRGICPSGWHIPSDSDWNTLIDYVGGSPTAGTKLKASSGWNSYSGVPAGQDTYGFAALPSGGGRSDGSFYDVGYCGDWWSASEYYAIDAYNRYMGYGNEGASWINYGKTYLFSVRCVMD